MVTQSMGKIPPWRPSRPRPRKRERKITASSRDALIFFAVLRFLVRELPYLTSVLEGGRGDRKAYEVRKTA